MSRTATCPPSLVRHPRVRTPTSLFLRCLTVLLFLTAASFSAKGEPLLVSAAASLTDVLREIADTYNQANPDKQITYNFGGSGTLQRQIENGAPVDVFISAAAEPMDALEKQYLLLPGSRRDLLTNTLVLIAPKERNDLQGFADLERNDVKHIAIGEPRTVPAGFYAVECLSAKNLLPSVQSKLVRLLNVRQVLAAVGTGNADAGLVYRTDAMSSDRVRTVASAPAGSHRAIKYPVAIVRRSKQPEEAREYIRFLRSAPARKIFEKHGFTVAQ